MSSRDPERQHDAWVPEHVIPREHMRSVRSAPRLTWRQVNASGRVLREQAMMPGGEQPGLPLLIRVVSASAMSPTRDEPHGLVMIDWMPADGGAL